MTNAPVVDREGLIGYGDAVFSGHRLVVEADGRAYQDDPAAFQRHRVRQNRMVLAGWNVLRCTWHDIARRPDHVIATVRAHLTGVSGAG